MRKLLAILVFLILFTIGCSSQTLHDAINGKYESPEILYQNDDVGVVIFLTKNNDGDYIICRSSYERNNFNRYVFDSNDDFSFPIDISNKSEFIYMDIIGEHTETPLHMVWGGIFHYPSAKHVAYKVQNNEGTVIQNEVDINKKHIFVDILAEGIEESHSITFDVMDRDGNILFSYN
ncbi:hypothetical protein [Ornithinibacillus californiensis]|uniref:hypothetical protein n=1 Tax=Ornithinibacillus californiensis TaxID=161536 RepID=UPI00064E1395|nr:hypothetical protein [Ornithinibacillus californiensis]